MQRTIDTISNRINELGLAETSVQQYGRAGADYEILVQLPGVDDPARVKELIGTAAVLEIDDVKDGPFASREALLAQHGGVLPLNTKLAKAKPRGAGAGRGVVPGEQDAGDHRPRDAQRARRARTNSASGKPISRCRRTAASASAAITEANIGNKLAVVLDNQIVSVATIQRGSRIPAASPGWAAKRKRGPVALPAVRFAAGRREVPGRALRRAFAGRRFDPRGHRGGHRRAAGGGLVMLVYYKRSGMNAVLALVLNTVILLAAISYFHAALTLPGIAGVILTIGMAVDSNVLIFERIREELRAGKGVIAAVDTGFNKAWWTIVDTHVTTMVSCAFLFLFGEGPVKGFAVTLTIGLIANVFTAVFVSRTIFDYELSGRRQMEALSI